jgi:hypothetical protein
MTRSAWRVLMSGALAILLSGVPSLAIAQPTYVFTVEDAPIFVAKDDQRLPLRTAKEGSRLKVLTDEGDWLIVEFEDPQWGRRQGYIQRRHITPEASVPVDVSVREPVSPAPLAEAASRAGAAAAVVTVEPRGMPGGLKWTGIGLLIGAGASFTFGALLDDGDCFEYDYTCDELREGAYVFGAILAGTGVTLLAIGTAKSGQPRTSLDVQGGRLMLRHRVRF